MKSYNFLYAGPNGEVRQVLGEFTVSNLLELQGGKVIVGTNENGVPNERSASILGQHLGHLAESSTLAPLDIPRFDNARFKSHKEQIIKDVEVRFYYQCKQVLPCFIHLLTFTFLCVAKVCLPKANETAYMGLDPKDG